jgi:hypothetical protein
MHKHFEVKGIVKEQDEMEYAYQTAGAEVKIIFFLRIEVKIIILCSYTRHLYVFMFT